MRSEDRNEQALRTKDGRWCFCKIACLQVVRPIAPKVCAFYTLSFSDQWVRKTTSLNINKTPYIYICFYI